VVNVSGEVLTEEGQWLANYLHSAFDQGTADLLQKFLLERVMAEVEHIAPTLCHLLHQVVINSKQNLNDDA